MIKKEFFNKQFIVFVIIGVINTFVGTLCSYIYSFILQPNIAFVVGYITGTVVSYLLNSKFTFKAKFNLKKYFSFLINVIPNFIIQNISVYIIYNILNQDKLIAYILAAIIGVPLTFLLLRHNTFKQKK